jgi:hypothetical protein
MVMVIMGITFSDCLANYCVKTTVVEGVVVDVLVSLHPALRIQMTTVRSVNAAISNLVISKTQQICYINIFPVAYSFQNSLNAIEQSSNKNLFDSDFTWNNNVSTHPERSNLNLIRCLNTVQDFRNKNYLAVYNHNFFLQKLLNYFRQSSFPKSGDICMELPEGSLTQSEMMPASFAKLEVHPDEITADINHGTDTVIKTIARGWYC